MPGRLTEEEEEADKKVIVNEIIKPLIQTRVHWPQSHNQDVQFSIAQKLKVHLNQNKTHLYGPKTSTNENQIKNIDQLKQNGSEIIVSFSFSFLSQVKWMKIVTKFDLRLFEFSALLNLWWIQMVQMESSAMTKECQSILTYIISHDEFIKGGEGRNEKRKETNAVKVIIYHSKNKLK